MDLRRFLAWVILFAAPFSLPADHLPAGLEFCQAQQAIGVNPCRLQPCPCNPGEVTLQRFGEDADAPALCACTQPQAMRHLTRQKAAAACDEYSRTQRQPCFVSRSSCPPGFMPLAEFSDDYGNRFIACQDGRHEASGPTAHDLRELPQDQLLSQYNRLLDSLENRRIEPPKFLTGAVAEELQPQFRGVPLNRLSLINTRALSQGCFSDCDRVYCADDGQIMRWTDTEQPQITRYLLHQIAHAERCEWEGGRDRFVSRWFQYLPEDILQKLDEGHPIDADRVHFAMYMESHANNRADSVCRQLPNCRLE